MANDKEIFCDKNVRPWIITIVVLGIITAIWATATNDELFRIRRMDRDKDARGRRQQNTMPVPSSPQLIAGQIPINPDNMMLNAITRATPRGGIQLVHNAAPIAFQDVFKNAIRSAEPAVVDIHATCLNKNVIQRRGALKNAPSFAIPFTGNTDRFISRRPYENIGAGFIVDSKGYIITNYHVVENAASIVVTVTKPQPRDFQAKVVMTDPSLDIALLKIMSNELFPVCPIGNSGRVAVGDWVIAIGSPFGLDLSVTAGIISGIRKSITIDGNVYQDLIQTDTPINKGSSGGPLINLNGEVIGITTAIYAPTGVFSGTGFAIPIDQIKNFLRDGLGPDVLAVTQVAFANMPRQAPYNFGTGQSGRLNLGIEALPVNEVLAREFRLPVTRGVVINGIYDNSPAQNAGLLRGDTIITIDGVAIVKPEQIPNILQSAHNKRTIGITYYRNGQEADCTIFLR
ncbi:MAG: trypsin-like peptidase domain-containing protein [Candidatus Omnitrophota bacterium]